MPDEQALVSALAICSCLFLGSCGGGSTPPPPPPLNPVPTIQSISPDNASAGADGFTLTINGSNFLASSAVSWNGSAKQATLVSSSQMTTAIAASDLATQGMVQVAVTNPAPGGGHSSATFTVSAPATPIVASVSPSTAVVGGPAFTLTVLGNNFVQNSVVQWNGSNRPTTYVSNTELTASIFASDINGTVGNQPISVATPSPGGGNSNTIPILIEYPLPAINALNPSQVTLGSGAFTLNVGGSDFVNGATVYWNSVARVTQFVSSTQLTASILASDTAVAAGGFFSVTVQNPSPSAGISNAQKFALDNPTPVLSSLTPASAPAGTGFGITVIGSGFVPGAMAQFGGQSLPTSVAGPTSLSVFVAPVPVGNFSLTVLNPVPNAGVSNALSFDSTPSGPGGQFVPTSIDPTGTIVNAAGNTSETGRYYVFLGYLRDTCLTAAPTCVPSTIPYRPDSSPSVLAGGVSSDGRYVSSQLISGTIVRSGDLELSDSCLGASAGCVSATSTLLLGSVYPGVSMSSDGRYIVYGLGTTEPPHLVPLQVFDTCTGAPPGCSRTSIPVSSSAVPGSWSISADGRFIAYSLGQTGPDPTTITLEQITLHDSCLGAAPGCAPTDVAMSDSSLQCNGARLTGDAGYLSYTCGNLGDLYLQNTCLNVPAPCNAVPQHFTLPETAGASGAMVSAGGRFVFFDSNASSGPLSNHRVTYVHDSCNGASSGCTVRTALVSLATDGALANSDCSLLGISNDGQYVAIFTRATNLAPLPDGVLGASYIWKNPLF